MAVPSSILRLITGSKVSWHQSTWTAGLNASFDHKFTFNIVYSVCRSPHLKRWLEHNLWAFMIHPQISSETGHWPWAAGLKTASSASGLLAENDWKFHLGLKLDTYQSSRGLKYHTQCIQVSREGSDVLALAPTTSNDQLATCCEQGPQNMRGSFPRRLNESLSSNCKEMMSHIPWLEPVLVGFSRLPGSVWWLRYG